MAEQIRTIDVTIVVNTNKRTRHQRVMARDDEALEEFAERVLAELRELTEVNT